MSEELPDRLSQMKTMWTVLFQAHHGQDAPMRAAREQLLRQYGSIVKRYLLGALRDPEKADDLYQEFALRFVRGAFQNADPSRGRFRDFLKTTLYNLIVDVRRKDGQRRTVQLEEHQAEPSAGAPPDHETDQQFLSAWRDDLIGRTLKALEVEEKKTGQILYTVLRYRMDHPEAHSPDMAQAMSVKLGKEVTAGWVRKRLFMARERFAELLLDEVSQSLENAGLDEVEQELLEIGLYEYCKPALEKRRKG